MTLFRELTVRVSEENWEYLCTNRFFSDTPSEADIQAEFTLGTGIAESNRHLFSECEAALLFANYIRGLMEEDRCRKAKSLPVTTTGRLRRICNEERGVMRGKGIV